MSTTNLAVMAIILCLSFAFHVVLGFAALVALGVIAVLHWRAEERRVAGVLHQYAVMAKKERLEARRGVINI